MNHCLIFSHSGYILKRVQEHCHMVSQVGGTFGHMYLRPEKVYPCDHHFDINDESLLSNLSTLHKDHPISYILSFHEAYHKEALRIASELNIPVNYNAKTIEIVDSKIRFKEFLIQRGVDQSVCSRIQNERDLYEFGVKSGYPFVLKPIDGFASMGVTLVKNQNDIAESLIWGKNTGRQVELMAEKYFVGKEYSIECFSENGTHYPLCVTEKFKEPVHFVGLGHRIPALLPDTDRETILSKVKTMLTEVGLNNGPSHTEIILSEGKVRFVETHARIPGANITKLIEKLYGFKMIDAWIDQTMGKVQEPILKKLGSAEKFAVAWFLHPAESGSLAHVEIPDPDRLVFGDVEVGVLKKQGEYVERPARSSLDRIAYAIVVDDDSDNALEKAKKATSLFKVEMESISSLAEP